MGAVENELRDLERQYWQALKDRDTAAMSQMTEFPCIVAGAQGVTQVDEKTFATMMGASASTLNKFDLTDTQIRLLSDDVAIIAYKVREELTVENQAVTLEAADSSVWVRRDGRWKCAAHTEALAGDPYGRDRKPH